MTAIDQRRSVHRSSFITQRTIADKVVQNAEVGAIGGAEIINEIEHVARHTILSTVFGHIGSRLIRQLHQGLPFRCESKDTGPADAGPRDVTSYDGQIFNNPDHPLKTHNSAMGQTVLRLTAIAVIGGTSGDSVVDRVDIFGLHADQVTWGGDLVLESA